MPDLNKYLKGIGGGEDQGQSLRWLWIYHTSKSVGTRMILGFCMEKWVWCWAVWGCGGWGGVVVFPIHFCAKHARGGLIRCVISHEPLKVRGKSSGNKIFRAITL